MPFLCAEASAATTYATLFEEYRRLHDYFGRGGNDVMKVLRSLRDANGAATGANQEGDRQPATMAAEAVGASTSGEAVD